jgi:hypothetical protein
MEGVNRKKLLLVVVLLVAAIALFIATLGDKVINKKKVTLCEQIISLVQANDAQKSYDMLGPNARTTMNFDKWKVQVPILRTAWSAEAKPKLISDAQQTSLTSEDDSIVERYEITNFDSTYSLSCFIDKNAQGDYIIQGFSSLPKR